MAWHYSCVLRVDDPVGDLVRLPVLNRHRLTVTIMPVVAGFDPAIETLIVDLEAHFDLRVRVQPAAIEQQLL